MSERRHTSTLIKNENQDQGESTRELLEREDLENPLPAIEPIRTRNRAFAELLIKAGHPAVLVESLD